MTELDPTREAVELRNQLSSDKRRLSFFLGAGSSQAVGVPGLSKLTEMVSADLPSPEREHYGALLKMDPDGTLESVLNRARLLREMLGDDPMRSLDGISGAAAVSLDRRVCQAIRRHVGIDPPNGFRTHYTFAYWMKTVVRAFPLEVFTTNYDLLLERALEGAETPHFDGFVGTVSPFFRIATIEADFGGIPLPTVPRDWVRVWKLHGSIGWVATRDPLTGTGRIVRRFSPVHDDEELMVYPSRQKYADSRRLPFMAYQDRFRRLLGSGETLLVVCGYSFSDQHINEIMYQAMRSNPRLAVVALCYSPIGSTSIERDLLSPNQGVPNLTVYGPDGAVVGGTRFAWGDPGGGAPGVALATVWDGVNKRFLLGDFAVFVEFLRSFLGPRSMPVLSERIDGLA